MGTAKDIKVTEINKPDEEKVKNRLEELSIFLAKNWGEKQHNKEQKG